MLWCTKTFKIIKTTYMIYQPASEHSRSFTCKPWFPATNITIFEILLAKLLKQFEDFIAAWGPICTANWLHECCLTSLKTNFHNANRIHILSQCKTQWSIFYYLVIRRWLSFLFYSGDSWERTLCRNEIHRSILKSLLTSKASMSKNLDITVHCPPQLRGYLRNSHAW